VANWEGGGAWCGRPVVARATSHGFPVDYSTSGYGCSASVIAGEGDGMERDYAYHSARHFEDLDAPETIGKKAGERAVSRLNPVAFESGAMPVVYDPRVSSTLLGHFVGAISGSSIARKTSFLLDALGTQLFDSAINIIDCPHRKRGLRSKAFDGEGRPTSKTKLSDDGRLTQWILESASARQLGLQPTGHASRGVGGLRGINNSQRRSAKRARGCPNFRWQARQNPTIFRNAIASSPGCPAVRWWSRLLRVQVLFRLPCMRWNRGVRFLRCPVVS